MLFLAQDVIGPFDGVELGITVLTTAVSVFSAIRILTWLTRQVQSVASSSQEAQQRVIDELKERMAEMRQEMAEQQNELRVLRTFEAEAIKNQAILEAKVERLTNEVDHLRERLGEHEQRCES